MLKHVSRSCSTRSDGGAGSACLRRHGQPGTGASWLRLRIDAACPPCVRHPGRVVNPRKFREDRDLLAGAVVAALRRSAARAASKREAMQANTSVQSARGGAAPGARAARRVGGRVVAVGRRLGHRRSAAPQAARASATASGPASTRAGSSTSSAPTATRSTRAKPWPRPATASLGDVQVSIAAEVALDLHRAARRPGASGDRARTTWRRQLETLQITRVARAGGPRHFARRRAGARRRPSRRAPCCRRCGRASSRPVMRSRC